MKKTKWIALAGTLCLLLGACGAPGAASSAQTGGTPATSAPAEPEPITATLAVCGDIMSHMPQTRDAWNGERYDYSAMLSGARPWVEQADFAVANLETTFAGGPDYSGFPAFNTPDDLADDLKGLGFDLLLTANNHCLDRGFDGLARTLDVLDARGLKHVGTYRTEAEQSRGAVVADVGGISVAFLGYTYGTNGIPLPAGREYAVNVFHTDFMGAGVTPDTARLQADLAAARALEPDLIAVMIHWGVEYQTAQNAYQEQLAQLLFENGADIILGGHSHVPQPMELRTIPGTDGAARTGFVCYSLGNFISAQNDRYTDTTAVLTLKLTKDPSTGRAGVDSYTYAPMLMLDRESGAEVRYQLLDVYNELAAGQADAALTARLTQALDDCHSIFGSEGDPKAAKPAA